MTPTFSPIEQQFLVWASVAFSAFVASLVVAAVMAHLAATRKK